MSFIQQSNNTNYWYHLVMSIRKTTERITFKIYYKFMKNCYGKKQCIFIFRLPPNDTEFLFCTCLVQLHKSKSVKLIFIDSIHIIICIQYDYYSGWAHSSILPNWIYNMVSFNSALGVHSCSLCISILVVHNDWTSI